MAALRRVANGVGDVGGDRPGVVPLHEALSGTGVDSEPRVVRDVEHLLVCERALLGDLALDVVARSQEDAKGLHADITGQACKHSVVYYWGMPLAIKNKTLARMAG